MVPDQILDNEHEMFEIILDRMIRSYNQLYKNGFPQEETTQWENRLKKLSPTAQRIVRSSIVESTPDDNDKFYRMSEARFDRIADRMIRSYATLIRKGLPKEETVQWESRLSKLSPTQQSTIRETVEIDESLRDALADRHYERISPSR